MSKRKGICDAGGCNKPAYAHRLCYRHYTAWRKISGPLDPPEVELPGEIWAAIPRFPGYEASQLGRVRNIKGSRRYPGVHVLCPKMGGQGYLSVTLYKDGRPSHQMVHRLVAAAFLGPRPVALEVRHLNDVKTDNQLENLVYGTRSENKQDAVRNGIHPPSMQTHCVHGHEFTPENTYRAPGRPAHRRCKACIETYNRSRKAALGLE